VEEQAGSGSRRRRAPVPGRGRPFRTAFALVLALAACSPTPPPISDPREILRLAVEHLRAASSVHIEGAIDGQLDLAPVFGGTRSSALSLTGTRFEGDLAMAANRAAIRFEVPAVLGLTGELRQIGDEMYLTSTLTSRGWHHLTGAGALPFEIGRPVSWLDALTAWLDRPANVPTRLDDASCRSGTCYVVRLSVSAEQLAGLASAAPGSIPGLAEASLMLELRVDRATLGLSEATLGIDLRSATSISMALRFSSWGAPVTIEPPPAGEVVEGPLLP